MKAGLDGIECGKKVDLPESDGIAVTIRIDVGGGYLIRGLLQNAGQLLGGETRLV